MPHANDTGSIIDVVNSFVDGWHEFTSPQIPGLYIVAEQDDLQAAYNDLPHAIEMLIEADQGHKVRAVLRPPYSEYVKTLPLGMQPKIRHYEIQRAA